MRGAIPGGGGKLNDPVCPYTTGRMRFLPGMLLTLCVGCTSAGFKAGAHAAGPYLAGITGQYIVADASLTPAQKAERTALTDALQAATLTPEAVTLDGVEAAWRPVAPMFYAYTDADVKLEVRRSERPGADFTDRQLIQDIARRLDALIKAERARIGRFLPSPAS